MKSKREFYYPKVQNRGQESASKTDVKAHVDIMVGVAKGDKEKDVSLLEPPRLSAFIFCPS